MPRVLPSEVVEAIDRFFGWARAADQAGVTPPGLSTVQTGEIATVLELVDHIPDEFITLAGRDRIEFIASLAAMRASLGRWRLGEHDHYLIVLPGTRDFSPVRTLRGALAKCPDEVPAPTTAELPFIADRDLRESLRLDLSEAHAALRNGQWKAATVLGGSLLEALLLSAISRREDAETARALAEAVAARAATKPRAADPESWTLHQYIPVAERLGIIGSETAEAAQLAKEFRNLVHPGRARRLSQAPSRGTAHVVLGAVELVAEDLRRQMATERERAT